MRTFLVYAMMELKRALKVIPGFLAGAAVLVILLGAAAFSAGSLIYKGTAVGRIPVGMILPEDDRLAKQVISALGTLDSVKTVCDFVYVNREEGEKGLADGRFYCLMDVPAGFVQDIMDGTNTPVTVIFPENAGVEAGLMRKLTSSAARTLSVSQAAIYAADELCRENGREDLIPQAEKDLNTLYLKYSASREGYFGSREVSAAGQVSMTQYYGIAGFVLALLLLGIPAASFLAPGSPAFEQKLRMLGVGRWKAEAARGAAVFLLFGGFSLAAGAAAFFLGNGGSFLGEIRNPAYGAAALFLTSLLAAALVLFIYELAGSMTAGVMVLFFGSLVMAFLGGGLLPSVFLPAALRQLGKWMPAKWMLDALTGAFAAPVPGALARLAAMAAVFFCLAALARRRGEYHGVVMGREGSREKEEAGSGNRAAAGGISFAHEMRGEPAQNNAAAFAAPGGFAKEAFTWCLLSVKRQLKRPGILMFLAVFLLALAGLGRAGAGEKEGISIALFAEDDGIAPEIMERLTDDSGILDFYVCGSREELLRDVETRKAECGYIFSPNLKEKLDGGTYRRSITVVSSPSTVLAELSTETVYAGLIDVYGEEILRQYFESSGVLPADAGWEHLEMLYQRYLTDGSTFSFAYTTAGEAAKAGKPGQEGDPDLAADSGREGSSALAAGSGRGGSSAFAADDSVREGFGLAVFPARGFLAVCVFVMGLFSAAWLAKDGERGLFLALRGGRAAMAEMITAGAPVFLAGVFGLGGIALAGQLESFPRELAAMAVYVPAVTVFSVILAKLARKPAVILGIIPFLALASLIICPVFIDLAPFVPAVRLLRWAFLPFYYLRAFS